MSWKNIFEFELPALGKIQETVDGIRTAAETIQDGAQIIVPILSALARFGERQDVAALATRTTLLALRSALDDFVKDHAGHMLVIPMGKPFARAPGRPDLVMRDLEELTVLNVLRAPASTLVGDGGNYGLYRKIVESLYDVGDMNRPKLDPNSVVAGAILVFGSDTFLGSLQATTSLGSLFGFDLSLPVDHFVIKVPQNLKVRPTSVSSRESLSGFSVVDASVFPFLGAPDDPPPFGAFVSWDDSPVLTNKLAYGRFTAKKVGWRVYAKPDDKIRVAEPVAPWEVARGKVVSAAVPVVGQRFEGNFNGVVLKGLDPARAYWVSAAWVYELNDPDTGETVTLEPSWDVLSTQRRLCLAEQGPIKKFVDGRPPDWIAITSPLSPFARLRQTFATIQSYVDLALQTFADFENDVDGALDQLETQLENLLELANSLDGLVDETANALAGFQGGAWVATFSGRGGNPFFVNEMGRLLLDGSTPNRPPFDRGDEALSAIVLLTESTTLGGVQDFMSLLDLLLAAPDQGGNRGFVVSDVNRIPPETPETHTPRPREQKNLHELGGVVDEDDPC